MAICFLTSTDSRESYTGNLQALFVLTGISSRITRMFRGIFTMEMLPSVVLGAFFINIGKWVGTRIA